MSCSQVLHSSLSVSAQLNCHTSCSQVLHSSLSVSAQLNCHIIGVSSLVTESVNFDPKMFVFLRYVLSENDPSFVQYNYFVSGQVFRRAVIEPHFISS